MNFQLASSYFAQPIKNCVLSLNLQKLTEKDFQNKLTQQWNILNLKRYTQIDYWISLVKQKLCFTVNNLLNNITFEALSRLLDLLRLIINILKIADFYGIKIDMQSIMAQPTNLTKLYFLHYPLGWTNQKSCSILKMFELLSEIETYNRSLQNKILYDFKRIAMRHIPLILNGLKQEGYYPTQDWIDRMLRNHLLNFDKQLSLEANYNNLNNSSLNYELWCILNLYNCLRSIQGVLCYLNYMKYIMVDVRGNFIGQHSKIWQQIYLTQLHMYSRHIKINQEYLLMIDTIIPKKIQHSNFEQFLHNSENVDISMLCFYLRNCCQSNYYALQTMTLKVIHRTLDGNNPWNQFKTILYLLQNIKSKQQKVFIIKKIKWMIQQIIKYSNQILYLYDTECGLTILAQFISKNQYLYELVLNQHIFLLLKQMFILKNQKQNQIIYLFISYCIEHGYSNQQNFQVYLEANSSVGDLLLDVMLNIFVDKMGHLLSSNICLILLKLVRSSNNPHNKIYWKMISEICLSGKWQNLDYLSTFQPKQKQYIADMIINHLQIINYHIQLPMKILSYSQSVLYAQSFQFYLLQTNLLFLSLKQCLNYVIEFISPLIPNRQIWNSIEPNNQKITLLSLISQSQPLELLKFAFKRLRQQQQRLIIDVKIIINVSPRLWKIWWIQNTNNTHQQRQLIHCLSHEPLNEKSWQFLQELRQLQWVLNGVNCVFLELNEKSQRNIKQLKTIYNFGMSIIVKLIQIMQPILYEICIDNLTQFAYENKSIDLEIENIVDHYFIQNNHLFKTIIAFNEIGIINNIQGSQKLIFHILRIPSLSNDNSTMWKIIASMFNVYLIVEGSSMSQQKQYSKKFFLNDQWCLRGKNAFQYYSSLLRNQQVKKIVHCNKFILSLNSNLKQIVAKLMINELMKILSICQIDKVKKYFQLYEQIFNLQDALDNQYEEHYFFYMKGIESICSKQKDLLKTKQVLRCCYKMFFWCISRGIRIRSYYSYQIINKLIQVCGERRVQFNRTIVSFVTKIMKLFNTQYKENRIMLSLCQSQSIRRNINEITISNRLNPIQLSCTLNMLINLLVRLNYESLSIGFRVIYREEQLDQNYITYLYNLTQKLNGLKIIPSKTQLKTLGLDVYGNLTTILSQQQLSSDTITKLLYLSISLKKINLNLNGYEKLPTQIIMNRINKTYINISEFKMEDLPNQLAIICYKQEIDECINSNIHLANLVYVSGGNINKMRQLLIFNHNWVVNSKECLKELQSKYEQRVQLCEVKIQWKNKQRFQQLLKLLMNNIANSYYQMIRGITIDGLFANIKIIISLCYQHPELINIVIQYPINNQLTFFTLIINSLKYCLPMFCQFYLLLLKTNCGFINVTSKVVPLNFFMQVKIKIKLLDLLISNQQVSHLENALLFVLNFSDKSRFMQYNHININQVYGELTHEFKEYFLKQILFELKDNTKYYYKLLSKVLDQLISKTSLNYAKVILDQTIVNNNSNMFKQEYDFNIQRKVNSQISQILKINFVEVLKDRTKQSIEPIERVKIICNKNIFNQEQVIQLKNMCEQQGISRKWMELQSVTNGFDDMLMHQLENIAEDKIVQDDSDEDHQQQQISADLIKDKQQNNSIDQSISIKIVQDNSLMSQLDETKQQLKTNEQIQFNKEHIIVLMQEYLFNPEVLKNIKMSIEVATNQQLLNLFNLCENGHIKSIIQIELNKRNINFQNSYHLKFSSVFINEIQLFKQIQKSDTIYIPFLTQQQITSILIQFCQAQINSNESVSNKYLTLILIISVIPSNFFNIIQFAFRILTNPCQSQNKNLNPALNKIFGHFLKNRIGISIILLGNWNYTTQSISYNILKQFEEQKLNKKQTNFSQQKVLQLIMWQIISNYTNRDEDDFLSALSNYIQHLNHISSDKYEYPYYNLQQKMHFSSKTANLLITVMFKSKQYFSKNKNLFQILKILLYIDFNFLEVYLTQLMIHISSLINTVSTREKKILSTLKNIYSSINGQIKQDSKLIQTYWRMRKIKSADQNSCELQYYSLLLSDLCSIVLQAFKQILFHFQYEVEDIFYKNRIQENKFKLSNTNLLFNRNQQCKQLELLLQRQQDEYQNWKKKCINIIIKQDIEPVLKQIFHPVVIELQQVETLLWEVQDIIGIDFEERNIIYHIYGYFYKIILTFQMFTKKQEHLIHSMSLLKTIPSIQSTQDTITGRRRSSFKKQNKLSINLIKTTNINHLLKKIVAFFPFFGQYISNDSPIYKIHAKYGNTASKIKALQTKNTKGNSVIECRRTHIWQDTIPYLNDDFSQSNIMIKMDGQIGIDYGGISREWVTLISHHLVNPDIGLFELNLNKLAFQPSKYSYLVPNHLTHFQKFGMLIGKAMKQNWLIQINFTRSFLKHLLGFTLYVQDLQDIDPHTARSLLWILNNPIGEDLGIYFVYQINKLDTVEIIELIPGGHNILVNQNNKKQFVKKLANVKMTHLIRQQSKSFMKGIQKIIPYETLKLFSYKQIGIYLSGMPKLDLYQMRQYAQYEDYDEHNENIEWFWQALQGENEQGRANFLFFLTGAYKVPYGGFKEHPIRIKKIQGSMNYLPVAHTCFSLIDLPQYSCKTKLVRQLKKSIKQGQGYSIS